MNIRCCDRFHQMEVMACRLFLGSASLLSSFSLVERVGDGYQLTLDPRVESMDYIFLCVEFCHHWIWCPVELVYYCWFLDYVHHV